MGALRFWFEVYCHAVGIPVKNYADEEVKTGKFQESLKSKLKKEIDLGEAEDMALAEQDISLSSRIFGCTGWKGQIKIQNIKTEKDKRFNNYWQDKLNIPGHKGWFFPKKDEWFFGNIEMSLISKQEIIEDIIKPLFNFLQQYGVLGGKNNLGYGRVKFTIGKNNIKENVFKFSHFRKRYKENFIKFSDNSISNALEEVFDFTQLLNCKKIGLWKYKKCNNSVSFKSIMESLIKYKATQRVMQKNNNIRHYKFGSTASNDKYYINNLHDEAHKIPGPNATKIIPWINKINDNNYEYGFISLVGLQNFGIKMQVKVGMKEKNDEF